MYRRGPSKSTPANVQCQKCLKKGHYSYECKASAQERPYIARPSRTQQLMNPKLAPKLSEGVPDFLQKKKGVADEQLAKREAERAKKRELERDDEEFSDNDGPSKRRRSASYDSVRSISTRGSPRSARGRPMSRSPTPPPKAGAAYESPSPERRSHRGQSYDSTSDYDHRRRSPSPPRHRGRGRRVEDDSPVHSRYHTRDNSPSQEPLQRRRRRYSSSLSRSPPREGHQRFRSRSPDRFERRGRSPARNRNGGGAAARGPIHPPPTQGSRDQRERSLSPFSKRLALTRGINKGG